ncbi:MAG: nucleoid-structuring protein H-NS, partial [Candidatus Omnitrophota bacterium]
MYRPQIKVLDCTIRDGGLINNHDFNDVFVHNVYKAISQAGVDYMEMGYKNSKELFSADEYGAWKFCDDDVISRIIEGVEPKAKVSVMVDVGRVNPDDVKPKKESPVDMIRVACYVKEVDKAIFLINNFADKGYETTCNIMAISRDQGPELTEAFHQLGEESRAGVVFMFFSF